MQTTIIIGISILWKEGRWYEKEKMSDQVTITFGLKIRLLAKVESQEGVTDTFRCLYKCIYLNIIQFVNNFQDRSKYYFIRHHKNCLAYPVI